MIPPACNDAGCAGGHGLLSPAGMLAEIQHEHLVQITLILMIVIVPVFVALPIVLWRYRLSRQNAYTPEWRFAWLPEIVIWGVPVIIVAVLSHSLWQTLHRIDPYRPLAIGGKPPLHVQVVGLDWKFLFIYPEQNIASVNRLVVPAGRQIAFDITADGPMMSFMVPRLGGQIYAMAGMRTKLHLVAGKPGNYRGLNTQYNGANFARQRFVVKAVSEADFGTWIAETRKSSPLHAARYCSLARPSLVTEPLRFGKVQRGLFGEVIAAYHGGESLPCRAAMATGGDPR